MVFNQHDVNRASIQYPYCLHCSYPDASGAIMIGIVVMIFRYQSDLSDVFYNFSMHYSELVRMDGW